MLKSGLRRDGRRRHPGLGGLGRLGRILRILRNLGLSLYLSLRNLGSRLRNLSLRKLLRDRLSRRNLRDRCCRVGCYWGGGNRIITRSVLRKILGLRIVRGILRIPRLGIPGRIIRKAALGWLNLHFFAGFGDFPLELVLGFVEFANSLTSAPGEFREFFGPEKDQYNKKYDQHISAEQVT